MKQTSNAEAKKKPAARHQRPLVAAAVSRSIRSGRMNPAVAVSTWSSQLLLPARR